MRAFPSALAGILLLCSAITLDALAVERPRLRQGKHGRRRGKKSRTESQAKSRDELEDVPIPRELKADSDMVMVAGVPVYGYHSGTKFARKTGSFESDTANVTSFSTPVITWIVNFKDISAVELTNLCETVFVPCQFHGHLEDPEHPGLPMLVTQCTGDALEQELIQAENMGLKVSFVEHDQPIQMTDAHLDFSEALVDRKRAATWGLDRVGKDSAPSTGANVHAYVLDTGVRTTHSDFTGRAIPTMDARTSTICGCNNTACGADVDGHGTHCASTLGGATYGVAPDARIHGVKVFNDDGTGSLSFILTALDFVLYTGQRPALISFSGAGFGWSSSIYYSVNRLFLAGVPFVSASGNANAKADNYWPGNVPNAINVASIGKTDGLSYFANYGSGVDILAPGESVLAAGVTDDDATSYSSGTSMACPHVSGAVAILMSMNPTMSCENVTAELLAKAESGSISIPTAKDATPNLLLKVDQLSGTVTTSPS